jgi:hypothetical protein
MPCGRTESFRLPACAACGLVQPMRTLLIAPLLFLAVTSPALAQSPTDGEIRSILIEESISRYSGNCPCPENRASNGSRCGKRSAWSRAGGAAPLCYPGDVSDAAVAAYRARHGGRVRDTGSGKPAPPSAPFTAGVPKSAPSASAGASAPPMSQSVSPLPDCRPGTTLARTNGQYDCAALPGTQSKEAGATPNRTTGATVGQQSTTFADVLSRLQAGASATGRPVTAQMGPPATGLLNCVGGTKPAYIDGRIECR